jgi:uncharacterized small protein (DUF1192 family)
MASTNFPNFYNPAPPPFSFTTVNGKITAWSVSASWTNGDGWNLSTVAITSTTEGDVVDEVGGNDEEIIGTSTAPGTWTCVQPVAQPYTAPPAPPPVDPLQAQVTALQAQVAALQAQVAADDAWKAEWIPYYQWQASGWQARAATLTQQLTNANNEIADLQAELKKK